MLSFWKVMLKSPTFWPFFSTNLSQKHKINFLSSMKLVTVPQKLFPNPKSNFTIREFFLQWLELVWQRYNCFSIFPIFHFSSRLPNCNCNCGEKLTKNLWQVEYDGVGDDWNDEAARGELLPASGDLILFGFCFL